MEPSAQVVCERVFLGTSSLKSECIAPGQDAMARHVAFESFAAAALFAAHPIHVRSATTNSRNRLPASEVTAPLHCRWTPSHRSLAGVRSWYESHSLAALFAALLLNISVAAPHVGTLLPV
jgi:hypothetical protein